MEDFLERLYLVLPYIWISDIDAVPTVLKFKQDKLYAMPSLKMCEYLFRIH
jgi:hypothetical protein